MGRFVSGSGATIVAENIGTYGTFPKSRRRVIQKHSI